MSSRIAAVGPDPFDGQAVVWVDEAGARLLASALSAATTNGQPLTLTEPPPGDPTPRLAALVIRASSGPVDIAIAGSELRITGDADSLRVFAGFIEEFVAYNDIDEPGMHTHVTPGFAGSEAWLSPHATELTIAGWVPDS